MENPPPPSRINQRTFLISVTASVVASIIVGIFFQPIIAFISDIVISFISLFYKGWVDTIYQQAAGSTLYSAVYFIISMITMFPLGVVCGILVMWFIATGTSRFSRRLRQGILPLRIVRRVAVLWIALGVPLMFIVNSAIYRAFQATATFDQRLMALAPVISDQERKSLLGQWAVMRGISMTGFGTANIRARTRATAKITNRFRRSSFSIARSFSGFATLPMQVSIEGWGGRSPRLKCAR
jgi:hypothetical protein